MYGQQLFEIQTLRQKILYTLTSIDKNDHVTVFLQQKKMKVSDIYFVIVYTKFCV